jgi:hypothetical protein
VGKSLIVTGAVAGVSVVTGLVTGALTDADSVGATVANAVREGRRRLSGVVPNEAELIAWERKVNRPSSKRSGIQIRPRVRTFPFLRGDANRSLAAYSDLCGEALQLSPSAGTIMAVIGNIEGGYSSGATYNRNSGNVKMMGGIAREDVTPPCYFLVDNINSLDAYQSFGVEPNQTGEAYLADNQAAWREGVSNNWRRTFGQPRYQNATAVVGGNRLTFNQLMNGGYLQQVCAIMGINGYAASYRSPSYMTARYYRLVRANRLRSNLNIVPARVQGGRVL